ncbi:MAG: hypothetical protein ABJL72_04920 [Roseobacter sp.]
MNSVVTDQYFTDLEPYGLQKLCNFLSASYRSGTVINAALKGRTDEEASFTNTFKTARMIGKTIIGRKATYIEQLQAAFEIEGIHGTACDYSDGWAARFDPGLIIDFPRIGINTTKWELASRSCLTVCAGGAQSKIWTRIVRAVSDASESLSETDLEELNGLSRRLSVAANETIRGLYEQDFSQTVDAPVELSNYGHIDVFAVDCVGREISEKIRSSTGNMYWSDEHRSLAAGELSDVMRSVAAISMPSAGQDNDSCPEFALHDAANFVPFKSSKGAEALFVAATDGGHAYLSGLVDAGPNVDAPLYDKVNELPLSSGATAELASQIGGAY